jgi:hypothetical protein
MQAFSPKRDVFLFSNDATDGGFAQAANRNWLAGAY